MGTRGLYCVMNHKFQDGDLVATRAGPTLDTVTITGRVVGYHDPTGSDLPNTCFYIILLDKKVEGFPWSTLILPGAMLDKLTVLDELDVGRVRRCSWCGVESAE